MGASIGYWQGDVQKLTEDIAALKPAIFLGVPRVFDRIYSKVMAQVGGGGPAAAQPHGHACSLSLGVCRVCRISLLYTAYLWALLNALSAWGVRWCASAPTVKVGATGVLLGPVSGGVAPNSCVSVRLAVQPTDGRTFAC